MDGEKKPAESISDMIGRRVKELRALAASQGGPSSFDEIWANPLTSDILLIKWGQDGRNFLIEGRHPMGPPTEESKRQWEDVADKIGLTFGTRACHFLVNMGFEVYMKMRCEGGAALWAD